MSKTNGQLRVTKDRCRVTKDVCALGIDVGSTTVKMVGVDAEGKLAWHWLEQAEPRVEDQVERFLARARERPPRFRRRTLHD